MLDDIDMLSPIMAVFLFIIYYYHFYHHFIMFLFIFIYSKLRYLTDLLTAQSPHVACCPNPMHAILAALSHLLGVRTTYEILI